MTTLVPVLALAAATLGQAPAAGTAADTAMPAEAPLVRIALFKNGLGQFVRRVRVSGDDRSVVVRPLPEPIHGTVWADAVGGPAVARIVAEPFTTGEDVPVGTIADLVR